MDGVMPHLLNVSVNIKTLDEINDETRKRQEHTVTLFDLVKASGVCEHSHAITWCSEDEIYPPQHPATWEQTTGWKGNESDSVTIDVKQDTTLGALFQEHLSATVCMNGGWDLSAADLCFGGDCVQMQRIGRRLRSTRPNQFSLI